MLKRVSLLLSFLSFFTAACACADTAPVLRITGAVKHPLSLTAKDLQRFQPVCARLNEVHTDGKFHGVFEYCGVPLRALLNLAVIQKKETNFSKPVDLAIRVKTKSGKEILLSWGEVFYRNPADMIIAMSANPVMPAKNCRDCHEPAFYEPWLNELKRPIRFPKLVVTDDFYTDRCLEDISDIEIIDLHPKVQSKKVSPLFSPEFNVTGLVADLRISDLSGYSHTEVWAKQVGEGKGFHGLKKFGGVPLIDLLKKAGVKLYPDLYILISAPDGYRSLLSCGELFLASSGREIVIADRTNDEPLEKNGKFILVSPHDLSADRWVKAVEKIEIGRLRGGADK